MDAMVKLERDNRYNTFFIQNGDQTKRRKKTEDTQRELKLQVCFM